MLDPAVAVLGGQGRQRPDRSVATSPTYGLPVSSRDCEQPVRAVPVPGEGHPAVRHQPARRGQGAAVRRRRERARLAASSRTTPRRRPRAAHRARSARSTTSAPTTRSPNVELTPPAAGAVRARRELHPAGRGPARPRPPLLDHDRQDRAPWAGAPQHELDDALAHTVDWYRDNREWWEPLEGPRRVRWHADGAPARHGRAAGSSAATSSRAPTAAGDDVVGTDQRTARRHRPRRRARCRHVGARPTPSSTARRGRPSTPARATPTGPSPPTPSPCAGWPRRATESAPTSSTCRPTTSSTGRSTARTTSGTNRVRSSVYGASKLAGEREALALGPAAAVVRTSWVCGEHGSNMVKTVLRLAPDRAASRAAGVRRRPARPPDVHRRPRPAAAPARRWTGGRVSIHATNQGAVSLVRVRAARSSPRPATTRRWCARSPPPSSTRRARRRARPTACSTTPCCAPPASRCCATSASRSPSSSPGSVR